MQRGSKSRRQGSVLNPKDLDVQDLEATQADSSKCCVADIPQKGQLYGVGGRMPENVADGADICRAPA